MILSGWSLRQRLWSIVGLVLLSSVAAVTADRITTAGVDRELRAVQDGYVPLLRYGPQVEQAFTNLSRAMQDAVAAQDAEALQDTDELRRETLQLLARAPSVVVPSRLQELERAFVAWSTKAFTVSQMMMKDNADDTLIPEIEAMQQARRTAFELLRSTVFLDETALAAGFANIRRAQQAAARTRMVLHAALFVSITLMILLIGRRVLSAFVQLQAAFERFGKGEFSEPVVIGGKDELATLGSDANQMAQHIDELQVQMRAQQHALEQANRELESFSYSVSHDLRAPLRAIDGFSQALLEDYAANLDEGGQSYLRRVRNAAQRMGELIDDLLSLSRVGRMPVERAEVNVTALAQRVAKSLAESDPARQVEWQIAPDVVIDADARLLTVALENLLGNAWKFTGKQSHARIELGQQQHVLYVRDNGAGFDMAYADKLFGAFQRLHTNNEFEGTGIGLATVNRVVNKHGGRIWAEARVGEGATFFMTLAPEENA